MLVCVLKKIRDFLRETHRGSGGDRCSDGSLVPKGRWSEGSLVRKHV